MKMCDLAGGVIVSYPVEGPGFALAMSAIETASARYGAHFVTSLADRLDAVPPPAWISASSTTPLGVPPSIPFAVDLIDVEAGAELSLVDEMRAAYLDAVLSQPAVATQLSDPSRRLAVSPNWKLHSSGVAEAVPEAFTLSSNHATYLAKVGLNSAQPNEASDITVAVLDNGFESSYWLQAPTPIPVQSGFDLISGDTSTSGHGTLVAAIIAASAPGADVVPLRMAGTDSTEWDTLHALGRAVQLNAQVLTISYRQILVNTRCGTCGLTRSAARSEVFERLLTWASDNGKRAILVAAGNDGVGSIARPASYPGAIPVAALDAGGSALATFSNWDATSTLTVLALPGEAVATGQSSGTSYEGTSFATGYAAAAYAVAMARHLQADAKATTATLTAHGSTVSSATVPLLT